MDTTDSTASEAADREGNVKTSTAAKTEIEPLFLDVHRRYRFLSSLSDENYLRTAKEGLSWEIQTQVLDYYPLDDTPFTKLRKESVTVDLTTLLANFKHMPPQVQPYLILQARFTPTVPTLHDAWQHEGQDVLLLEDRSHLQLLSDPGEVQPTPVMQLLHWLHEMVELWTELEPWSCRCSLLEPKNLRVDEDGMLCLQRLYSDPLPMSGIPPFQLQDLGQVWQQLLQHFQHPVEERITTLIESVCAGRIASASDLQIALEEIAYEVQQEDLTALDSPLSGMDLGLDIIEQEPLSWAVNHGDDDNAEMPTVVLPMKLNSLEAVCLTDVGKQRDHNEDFFRVDTYLTQEETPKGRVLHAKGLYILCDGMGGHASGEVASALAVETLREFFREHWQDQLPSEAVLCRAVLAANQALYTINQQSSSSGSGRMGTTLVLVLLQDTEVAFAHVGDSRLYRLSRKRGLEQLTLDHEVGQREIQRGVDPEIAYARPDAYQLTQALGPRDSQVIKPDIHFFTIREDMLLLLCSDGLTDNDLLENYWQSHLTPLLSSQANLDRGVSQLIELANQYNGHDNTTAIAVRVKVTPDLNALPR
jgi:protein phosphatase